MSSGVVVIDGDGLIETFNGAAAQILDLEQNAVVGKSFAEVFVANEAFDELNEAVLAAIYDGVVGHQSVVSVSTRGAVIPLAIATSYLRETARNQGNNRAVVAVFSDVSELEELRAREVELAIDLESKHDLLRSAYRDLEQRNEELDVLLRRVQVVRTVASVFVIVLILGIGAYVWSGADTIESAPEIGRADELISVDGDVRLANVERRDMVFSITVPGIVRPRGEVAVTSPIDGQVGSLHVQRGQSVAQGQRLLDLDVTQVQIQGRIAQAAYLEAEARVEELSNWSSSLEVSRAMRAVAKARIALEAANTKLEETTFLVDRGLVPASNRDAAMRERTTRQLDLETAEQDLAAVRDKGHESRSVANLVLANAEAELARIDWALQNATITAPVTGVVVSLQQQTSAQGQSLAAGASIQAGQHLLTIGDMAGVTVTGRVDEIDVGRIQLGDEVRVTGPAFNGIVLDGTVAHVSSQATSMRVQQSLPSFEITSLVESFDEQQREAVRLGMSAEMEIVVHHNDNAMVVPVAAVHVVNEQPQVRVWDASADREQVVNIETGVTTIDYVEVLNGLSPDDKLVIR